MDCTLQASETSEKRQGCTKPHKNKPYHQQYQARFSSGVTRSDSRCSRADGCQLSWIDSMYPNDDLATLEEVSLGAERAINVDFHAS